MSSCVVRMVNRPPAISEATLTVLDALQRPTSIPPSCNGDQVATLLTVDYLTQAHLCVRNQSWRQDIAVASNLPNVVVVHGEAVPRDRWSEAPPADLTDTRRRSSDQILELACPEQDRTN